MVRSSAMRSVTYRTAAFAFIFTSLWFIIGLLVLWSPLFSALGIHGGMFVAWLLLFFAVLGASGVTLIIASFNAAFPPNPRRPHRRAPIRNRPSAIARSSVQRGPSEKSHLRG